ncbi:MAG: hypothetical protein JSW25_05880 [Thermoplasmata archaeon]|nr:MAG: hypothetical protein JSW25_05880 [Thermoplasmata archaeon]
MLCKDGGTHMSNLRTLLPVAVIAMMLISVGPATAEVVWDHTLADDADDVESTLEPNVHLSDRGYIDILSASVAGQGDDVNVTLTLNDAWDSDAIYEVRVTGDDDDAKEYIFMVSRGIVSVNGPGLVEDNPTIYVSADGEEISWVVEKAKFDVTQKLEVTFVQTFDFSGMSQYVDTAPEDGGGNGGGNGGGSSGPVSVQAHVEFRKLEHVRYTIEVTIEDDDARALRGQFDTDVDGTVTQSEYDDQIGFEYLLHGSWNSTDIKLNGKRSQTRSMGLEFQGLVGSATSSAPITKVVVLDVMFAEPVAAGTHTYADFVSSSESAGDMWDVTTDSLWQMSAPDGWKFKTAEWPEDLKTYANSKGTSVSMSGFQMRSDWNTTMGVMTTLVMTEREPDNVEDETPGFALVPMVTALGIVALVVLARRR